MIPLLEQDGAGGRGRTDTGCYAPRILSPVRLPFRHTGWILPIITSAVIIGKEGKTPHKKSYSYEGKYSIVNCLKMEMEAPTRFELVIKVLQTLALPLGDGAIHTNKLIILYYMKNCNKNLIIFYFYFYNHTIHQQKYSVVFVILVIIKTNC